MCVQEIEKVAWFEGPALQGVDGRSEKPRFSAGRLLRAVGLHSALDLLLLRLSDSGRAFLYTRACFSDVTYCNQLRYAEACSANGSQGTSMIIRVLMYDRVCTNMHSPMQLLVNLSGFYMNIVTSRKSIPGDHWLQGWHLCADKKFQHRRMFCVARKELQS